MLFCDLAGPTALSARLDPEKLREVIAACHRAVTDAVRKQGGHVAKLLGDGVRPHLPRAHLMASSVLHRDTVASSNNGAGGRNDYGLGRISDYQSHWARPGANGWAGHWVWMTVTDRTWGHFDLDLPAGTKRLVVVLTWDEPAASAGASQAVTCDVDPWADFGAGCVPDAVGRCGEWASQSNIDTVEYLIIDNPPAGRYRLKAINWRAPASGLPVAIAAKIMRGDPTPPATLSATPSTTTPAVGSTFTVTTTVGNPAYGAHVSAPTVTAGLSLLGVSTTREDGVAMDLPQRGRFDPWQRGRGRHPVGDMALPGQRPRNADDPVSLVVGQRGHSLSKRNGASLTGRPQRTPRADLVTRGDAPELDGRQCRRNCGLWSLASCLSPPSKALRARTCRAHNTRRRNT